MSTRNAIRTWPFDVAVDLSASTGSNLVGFSHANSYSAGTVGASLANCVYVTDAPYNAKGDGVADDTTAFNLARATGKAVLVPWTPNGYSVSNIAVANGCRFIAEANSRGDKPLLIVNTNNAGAFLHSAATSLFGIEISGFACKAGAGVTGARLYKQNDKSLYSAYCNFHNNEPYVDLAIAYDGFFIFTDWWRNRSGYLGVVGASHQFINCRPAAYGQTNACNINAIRGSQIFGCVGVPAAIDIAYGNQWFIGEGSDFENMSVQPLQAQGVFNILWEQAWAETVTAAQIATLDVYPATSAGSTLTMRSSSIYLNNITAQLVNVANSLCKVHFEDVDANLIPAGVKLTNDVTRIGRCDNVRALSGAGASAFLTGTPNTAYSAGQRFLNGATDDGGGATFQQVGSYRASAGFNSTNGVNVVAAPTWTTVATSGGLPALVFIGGYNNAGGAQGWWLVAFNPSGAAATVIQTNNATGLVVSFQVSGNALQMQTTAGTLVINTCLLR